MDLTIAKREIKEEVDRIEDEKVLWAIARLLKLDEHQSPDWHKQIVEERFVEYEKNPQNVISWEDIKKKWKDEV